MNLTEDIQRGTRAPPTGAPPIPSPDDPRVVRALEEYSAALKAGQKPDRREFQARYPEIATTLAECLDGLEFVRATAPLLQPIAGGQPAAATEFSPEGPLGDYRILREIGRGGMGVVYEAVQISLGRQVALKVLPFAAALDAKQLQRFKNEAQAAAHLHHQNIVPVYGVGCERGVHYYAMQYINGQTLSAMIAELRPLAGLDSEVQVGSATVARALASELASGSWAPPPRCRAYSQLTGPYMPMRSSPATVAAGWPPGPAASEMATRPMAGVSTEHSTQSPAFFRTVANLGVQAAEALEYAHGVGVTHRDIKPANLLVDLRGNLWITDFGLSHFQNQAGLTMTGDLVGTLRYMSPEQALAQRVAIDHRTDVYSLGATLYELLTLEPVFDGRNRLELLRQIAFEEPKSPRRFNKSIPAELDTIVLKALEKNPADRYASAQELADDLGRFLNDESIRAKRPSLLQRGRKWARRHKPIVWSALVATVLVSLLAVGVLALSNVRINEEQKLTAKALGEAQIEKRQKTEQLWEALLAQARANRLSRRAGQRFETLNILQRATELARTLNLPDEKLHELRNAVIATLTLPDLHLAGPWNDWPADAHSFDFDAEHAVYARTHRQGTCSVRRVADDAELHRLPGLGGPAAPFLSRDGKFLAVVHGPQQGPAQWGVAVQLWNLEEATARQIRSEEQARFVDFRRNGQQVALAYNDGAINLFELPSGKQLGRLAPNTLTREVTTALHPTEPVVAVCSYFGSVVQLRDLRTGEVFSTLPQSTRPLSVAWHPDGRTLAVGLAEAQLIRLYDRTTLRLLRTLETASTASFLVFNHTGDRLAVNGWKGRMEVFDVGTGQKLFAPTPNWSPAPRFSRDDRRLAGGIQDGKLGIWQVGDGREFRTLVRRAMPEKVEYESVAVSPDGRLLAAGMHDGFGLWDLASGSELAFIPTGGQHNLVHFEPSGALLALCPTGLVRWPVRQESGTPGSCVLGPPERLPLPCGSALGQSRDGRVIVTCSRAVGAEQAGAGGWILHTDRPDQPNRLDAGADIGFIAVSPDARWVVTVNHPGELAKIWDARDGKLVKQLAEWGTGNPHFSPDGRWLSTGLDGGRLLAVGTWEPGPRMGGYGEFAPDSKLLAVPTRTGVIRLVDPATGRELATLEDPNLDATYYPVFTPDGAKLISFSNGKVKNIRVWDLRLIRRHLAAMGLDWEVPPYPSAEPRSETAQALKVEVRLGDTAKLTLTREQRTLQAIEHYRRGVAASPDSATAFNHLAWVYLTAPEALRDVKAGLSLAEKAVRLDSASANCRNTLGVAYYRAGRYREAVQTLRPNVDRQDDKGLAFDLYFLAMSHHHLGETARARDYYDWAVRWPRTHPGLTAGHLEELTLFRAEAAELLRIETKKD